ncbi:Small-conductance mechanosensitive channel [Paracoccus isoporae]|uniref:Small-conductance mechanosensitive channel n=1 Tax=Paracoccus isoporae TaxID=591205 RepID=A0A1G7AMC5_9RHOB|nr:mechanosensitive ion channel domain-containing protein [Paracoccus isoporae]SDE15165.1 Small-conductance mechanosensitive channel [Paracoccus isoporae]
MLHRFAFLLLTASLLFAPGLLAAQEAEPQPDSVIAVSDDASTDAAIRARIESILSELDGYADVAVDVSAGIVTLDGTALDSSAVERLDRLIGRVEGVVEIQNRVEENTQLRARLEPVVERFQDHLLQSVAFLPLLLVAVLAAVLIGWIGNLVARLRQPWDRLAPNPFIAEILRTAIRMGFWVAALVVALDILGATALLGTFLGAAGIVGIALGFAVRDTVENFIASVMLSLRQPFRPNDLVLIEGNEGRVIRLTSRATTLLSLDGNHIRIPNSTVFKAVITNYTRNPERRFIFDLGVDAASDLNAVRELGLRTLQAMEFVLPSPEPAVWVAEVGDSNVIMRFSGWVTQQGAEFNKARGEAIRMLKETLESAGYGLPEPIYRVRMEEIPPPGSEAVVDTAATTDAEPPKPQPEKAAAQPPSAADIRPDDAFERMVENSTDDGEPNLLSSDAPQE